ncbi:MAG TPA: hypothetical protein PKD85_09705, partial [Saprospiraceae bacterium]|nr:hypothetical protein [Saprospiraceae bacterium]
SNDFDCTRKVKNLVKMDCECGLLTWSKYPIVGHVFIPFPIEKTMNFEEKIGRKGFTITKIQAPKGLISVINTHLYAGNSEKCESFRLKQIQFIESYLSAKNGDIQNPVFFAGDFNTYSSEGKNSTCYDYIINQLNFCDTEIGTKENTFTYDHKTNFFAALNHSRQKLDHIFYKCNNAQMSISVDQSRVQFIHEESVSDHNGYSSMINLTYLDQIHTLTSSAAETSRTISKTQ